MHLLWFKASIQAKDNSNTCQSKMITCSLEVHENVDELYKVFMSEKLSSERAECQIRKGKCLEFKIRANDPVSMKAFLNTILKIIETYNKTSALQ